MDYRTRFPVRKSLQDQMNSEYDRHTDNQGRVNAITATESKVSCYRTPPTVPPRSARQLHERGAVGALPAQGAVSFSSLALSSSSLLWFFTPAWDQTNTV